MMAFAIKPFNSVRLGAAIMSLNYEADNANAASVPTFRASDRRSSSGRVFRGTNATVLAWSSRNLSLRR